MTDETRSIQPALDVEPAPEVEPGRDIGRLLEIMAALRAPETGCPWDLAQSFATIAPYTVEEAYEVADAIERRDLVDLREELGDLLLQVVYHARLAEEERAFDFGDVVHGITAKMIRRHPHVFGDERGASAEAVKATWERIKAAEKAARSDERARIRAGQGATASDATTADGETHVSHVLRDVPKPLPALSRAAKLQDRAAAVGFDWPSLAPVFDKVREELGELEDAASKVDPRGPSAPARIGESTDVRGNGSERISHIEEELGDLLFVLANVGRHLGIDPENALRRANAKFERRFGAVEAKLAARGRTPAESDLAQMDALWDEVKREERGT
ncbi:MAG: nucleoside triphosphate pyrophosphohydrolase [Hyphomicrobiaceae bacterium]